MTDTPDIDDTIKAPAASSKADRKMVELVRFLARRAAQRDFDEHLKASRGWMGSDGGGGGTS